MKTLVAPRAQASRRLQNNCLKSNFAKLMALIRRNLGGNGGKFMVYLSAGKGDA